MKKQQPSNMTRWLFFLFGELSWDEETESERILIRVADEEVGRKQWEQDREKEEGELMLSAKARQTESIVLTDKSFVLKFASY